MQEPFFDQGIVPEKVESKKGHQQEGKSLAENNHEDLRQFLQIYNQGAL